MTFKNKLIEMKACKASIKWVGNKDLMTAWDTCQRGDWMLWYMQKRGVDICREVWRP